MEEVGTSNIFFVIDGKLVTPPLNGTILGGITRDSVIQMAKSRGMIVEERMISIDEVVETCRNGTLNEMFASGTAAVISPVGQFRYHDEEFVVGDGRVGHLSGVLYQEISDIQYGRKDDEFGWVKQISKGRSLKSGALPNDFSETNSATWWNPALSA